MPWTMRTILVLSAVLVSSPSFLVAQAACPATKSDSEGPFYEANAPMRSKTGDGLVVQGTVRSTGSCAPLGGATIEWWQANPQGKYDDAHRATMKAMEDGRYRYESHFPAGYFFRSPHLHVKVSAPGHKTLTTQIYPESGQREIAFDFNLEPR